MGNLAKWDVKQKECGHQEEDPHEAGFRLSLYPQVHGDESHSEENGHENNCKIIVGAADYLDFRDCQSPVDTTQSDKKRQAHEYHDDRRDCGGHEPRGQRNEEGGPDRQRDRDMKDNELGIEIEVLAGAFHVPRSEDVRQGEERSCDSVTLQFRPFRWERLFQESRGS